MYNCSPCRAAKALLSCMSGKSGVGCDGLHTAKTIVTTAETAVDTVIAAGESCGKI